MQKQLKILHIAPMNTSGVPGQFVLAERQLGFKSRLVTLYRDKRNYFEDICLDLPFIDFSPVRWIKKIVSSPEKMRVDNKLRIPKKIPLSWQPHSKAEEILVHLRDSLWKKKIGRAIEKYNLANFDVYQLDGGLGFFRNASFISVMKERGKKIICCYTGSDLRTRGVIPAIDQMSNLNVTVEFDHTLLHPNIHHIFFPFNAEKYRLRLKSHGDKIRIGHAPTSWKAKGSDIIVPVLKDLEREYAVEAVLIENISYKKALELKRTCDIFVDQIGDLGYGMNSLESLTMGIPTCSCLAPGFAEAYPDHPFVEIDAKNLKQELIRLITDVSLRQELSQRGRIWVLDHHNAVKSVKKIHELAGIE